ncbi:APC family permease [Brevibacillus fluminis]|uniref:APC family permease n=1 Tax=Brevibacillus fluminis TaxID=511487 RepID=A0A3M8DQS9_9BACL|nr:APC family permease [Brevibacillus fluminis]RNB89801.1 APC family permease [Brevibacillus fluminis]
MNSENTTLQRRFTLWPLIFFGLAAISPGTVLTTFGIAAQTSHGMVPASYLIALAGLLFTAYSYGRMVKVYPAAGSAYTYTQKALSPHLGFIVGWGLLSDYLFMPMVNYLIFGIFLSARFPSIPFYVWTLALIILVTFINIRGVKLATSVNMITSIYGVLTVIFFTILSFKSALSGVGTVQAITLLPFFNPDVSLSIVVAGASLLCFSFLGFDSIATLTEETVDAKNTIPKAMMIVVLLVGVLFVLVSYAMQIAHPDYLSFKNPDSAALEIAASVGGDLFVAFVLGKTVMGTLGSGSAAHMGASRLLYAMGRDRVLPKKVFGYLHPTYKTPTINILLVSAFSLLALFMDLGTVASFINFGALLAFCLVNVSVIAHYFVKERKRSFGGTVRYLLLPLIGAAFNIWLITGLDKHSLMLGLIWGALGIIYLLYLTKGFKKRPPEMVFDEDAGEEAKAG